MSVLSKYLPAVPPEPALVLARGDAFFIRRVPLAAGEPVEAQIALALEGMAPFPPEQLYFGHLPAVDGQGALVFAAFRRRFAAEETEAWDGAALVAPEFLPLLAARPEGEGVTLHVGEARVIALGWQSAGDLPGAVVVRAGGAEIADAVVAEARARAELFAAGGELVRVEGALALRGGSEGGLEAWAGETKLGAFPEAWRAGADVRDPDFLIERRRAEVRDVWLWRGLLGAAALLVFAATLDIGAAVLGVVTKSRERQIAEQKPVVEQIDAQQMLANRIGELSANRLMPFEMMAIINPSRPDSVIFQRFITRGLLALEVEAQAANAEDVGTYAKALRALPGLSDVKTRDVRSKEGVTSFVLALEFKAEALRNGGAM